MRTVESPASKPQDFLHHLRAATSRSHDALHHNAMLRPLTEGRLTIGEYLDLMRRFLGFYRTLDPILAKASRTFADQACGVAYQPRSPFFEHDLRALDTDPLGVPLCPSQPLVMSRPAFAGALYVIEGSSLGGSVLERAAAQSIPPEARSYWIWCRENCRSRWLMTRQLLDQIDSPDGQNEAIRTAQMTFEAMLAWFEHDRDNPERLMVAS